MQVSKYYSEKVSENTEDNNNNSWSGILSVHDKLSCTKTKIDALLPNVITCTLRIQ